MLGGSIIKWNSFGKLLIQSRAYLFTGVSHSAKTNITPSQTKAFKKLFGVRVTGSKRRWYPSEENGISNSFLLNPNFGAARKSYGRNTIRRMNVLNKLIMEHITDLLATGEISQNILGRGLQISGVKISPDFAFVSVLWAGSGVSSNDIELKKELQRCSGTLRHQLSQLCLMGEVPRINFVHDKSMAGLAEVEALLCTVNCAEGYREEKLKREFLWEEQSCTSPQATPSDMEESKETIVRPLPGMRHDVLGLDHRNIMTKILTKMRRSEQAWDSYKKDINVPLQGVLTPTKNNERNQKTTLEGINQKLEATKVENTFERFLNKRKSNKNMSERKIPRNGETFEEKTDKDVEDFTSKKYMNIDSDYIEEEDEEEEIDEANK